MRKAARLIVERLRLHGHEAFFAGGWVRDFLLRRKPKDIDIATSALPDEVLRLFPNSLAIGAAFGVVQVRMYGHPYEVATFRKDNVYLNGRHPSSVSFSGPEQDAMRRDFTVNGLFYDPVAERLIDYVHGRIDLKNKVIRSIGNPNERFAEDKLRIMRAIRFACDLDFKIEEKTWEALKKFAPDILQVSWERIRDELFKILTGPAPGVGLNLLQESNLLQNILPEVEATCGIPQSADSQATEDAFTHSRKVLETLRKPSYKLALGALLHEIGKPPAYSTDAGECFKEHAETGGKIAGEICRRLRMSNEDTEYVADLVANHSNISSLKQARISVLKKFLRKSNIADHLELYRANRISSRRDLDVYKFCMQKLKEYRSVEVAPLINGQDLIDMGYSSGPIFREILQEVEDLQLEGSLKTREEAIEHIKTSYSPTGKNPA